MTKYILSAAGIAAVAGVTAVIVGILRKNR